MRIEIDQSGKIENTNRPTVVAFANKKQSVLVILSKDKKLIQKYFRAIGKPKLFVYFTFIALVYCLINHHLKKRDQVVIDREYPGYEKLISTKLKLLLKDKEDITVSIAQIGKKSSAHDLAWNELQSKSHKNVSKVSSERIIKILKKSGSV